MGRTCMNEDEFLNLTFQGPLGRREAMIANAHREISAEIVDHSLRGNTLYLAVHDRERDAVIAMVYLYEFHRDGSVCWKVLDEMVAPLFYNPPKRLLNRLTPIHELEAKGIPVGHAAEWRANCERQQELQRQGKGLKDGDRVRFSEPLRFGFGTASTFRKVSHPRHRLAFQIEEGDCPGQMVRLRQANLQRPDCTIERAG